MEFLDLPLILASAHEHNHTHELAQTARETGMWAGFDLPFIWSGILALAVFLYVVLDGFDLGVGILFPLAASTKERNIMMKSIAPVWDGNESWLLLGGVGLFAAFPLAYATIMPAIYLPLGFMLIALAFRGVAFAFRRKALPKARRLWSLSFHLGSIMAAFSQGLILGTIVQGVAVEDNQFVGGSFDWFTPFSLFAGVALVAGYALLGATWLVMKTNGNLLASAHHWSKRLSWMVIAAMAIVSIWVPFLDTEIAVRWGLDWPQIDYPQVLALTPVPLLTAAASFGLVYSVNKQRTRSPFCFAIALFALGFLGLGISVFPFIVPYSLTLWDAAAPTNSLTFLLAGTLIMLPIILCYTAYIYWIFRGKIELEEDENP